MSLAMVARAPAYRAKIPDLPRLVPPARACPPPRACRGFLGGRVSPDAPGFRWLEYPGGVGLTPHLAV